MEVEPLEPRVPCAGGYAVGNGKGRPMRGAMRIET